MSNLNRELVESEKIVFDELLKYGYPKESIVLEGQLDFRRFVDFLINDTDTGFPLMILVVKSCSERTHVAVRKLAFESLKKYYRNSSLPIKAVAAILDREEKRLEFIDFTEAIKDNDFNQAVNGYHLPPYEILTIGARQKAINKQKKNQERKIVALKWICWLIIPLLGAVLVLLDAFGIYMFSTLRLITIGVCVAVTLIPCFKEIKIGEITLKSTIEKQKEETK